MERHLSAVLAVSLTLAACSNPTEDAVRATLIDPESGEFRDVEKCQGDSSIWRGEVNGKNRMGAYTGFSPFFYDGASVVFVDDGGRFDAQMDRCYSHLEEKDEAEASTKSGGDAKAEGPGSWRVSEDINPLDDSKTVVASLSAIEGASRFDGPYTFIARCDSNTTEVYVIWHDYLGDDSRNLYEDWKYVEVRIGEAQAERQRWGVSTDKQATFAPDSISLLRSLITVDRLVLQTTPYNEAPQTAIFDLTGVETAVGRVAETCNWDLY